MVFTAAPGIAPYIKISLEVAVGKWMDVDAADRFGAFMRSHQIVGQIPRASNANRVRTRAAFT